jgi:protein TonB
MIINKKPSKGVGIQILPKRFHCYLSKNDRVFNEGKNYLRNLKLSLVLSLLLCIVSFQVWKRMIHQDKKIQMSHFALNVEEIPQTKQEVQTPVPKYPTVPIASEDEYLPTDETIDDTYLDLDYARPLPLPPPEDDVIVFVPYDEPPAPIGGFAAIRSNLVYPEIATRAGIFGTVYLQVHIDKNGNVDKVRVLKSVYDALDQAAINAVYDVKWKPAKQRDTPVAVWLTVPIEFKLVDTT